MLIENLRTLLFDDNAGSNGNPPAATNTQGVNGADAGSDKKSDAKPDVQTNDYDAKLAAFEAKFNEREKFWASKFDSVNSVKTKLEKELEDKKKESMTEAQKHQYELEQKQKLIQEKEFELNKRETEIVKRDVLKEHGLMDLTDLNLGSDKESIQANTVKIKSIIENAVNSRIQEFMKSNGYKPQEQKQTQPANNNDFDYNSLKNMSPEDIKKIGIDNIINKFKTKK